MTQSHRLTIATSAFLVLIASGCASRSEKYAMSLVPPVPKTTEAELAAPAIAEPLMVAANILLRETPGILNPPLSVPPRPSNAMPRAERRFQEGKRLYQEGRLDEARQYFDAAIDILLESPESATDPDFERKFDDLVRAIYRYDVDGLGAGETSEEPVYEQAPLDAMLDLTFPIDPKLKNKLSEELKVTVSQLPLEVTDAVVSYVNFFSSERGRRIVAAGLRRSGRYRNLISRILDEEGVPQELIYLAQAESGFMPRAVSRKAATGMWQFILSRGREYGLNQTPFSDDRLDPEKATRAAARHLRDLYTDLGDWYLAMAAYNCGPQCVERAVARTGYADFWELRKRNALPRETANYVPAILAMTIVAKNAKDYGLDKIEFDPPLEYDVIELTAPTSLALVADAADRSVTELRELNPALLKPIAPAGFELRVPKGTATSLMAAIEAVPSSRRTSWRMHRVESGDTLRDIARQYNAPVNSIAEANGTALHEPEAGDLLIIPAAAPAAPRTTAAPQRRPTAQQSKSVRRPPAKRPAAQRKSS